MKLYPLRFEPIFQERLWGGRNLERLYGKALPPGRRIGESWEISDRPEAASRIAYGPLAGETLAAVLKSHEGALLGQGRAVGGRFPLLVKILDAEERLSLQVHPPPALAAGLSGEPKSEMWYVAEAREGAEIFAGLRRGATRAEFEARLADGSVAACFHRIVPRTGDVLYLPSGRVHGLGGGLVIFEIQQNSDTTYRVFDWNRRDDRGQARALHVRESLACIDFHDFEPAMTPTGRERGPTPVVESPYFRASCATLTAGDALTLPLSTALVVGVVEGEVVIEGDPHPNLLATGEFCLLPASLGRATLAGRKTAKILFAEPS